MATLSYEKAGVNYDSLDAFKRACQKAAGTTKSALANYGYSEPESVRGESAYLVETPTEYLAHVEEGLGTKNLVADKMLELTGKSFYRHIGIDTVATITNDLITSGALPISIAMHAAVGDGKWFDQAERAKDLVEGFAEGCRLSKAVWGGGETPALKGMVDPKTIILAGSAFGKISPKSNLIRGDVKDGDAIIFFASSGVQTNGLTLCRLIADKLPKGYLTPISDGRTYGEALLDPSVIYVSLIAAYQKEKIPVHYASHITGHGWRKIMRLSEPFVYEINEVPEPLPIFKFLMEAGPIDLREAYATFNMGIGFAVYVSPNDAQRCIQIGKQLGFSPTLAGNIRKDGSRKAVEIKPLSLTFKGDTLNVR